MTRPNPKPTTVPAQPSAQFADWNNVRQSLAHICASYDEFDGFLSGVFDRLEEVALDLVHRQQSWASERNESESELSRQREELAQARQEIEAARDRLAGEPSDADEQLAGEVRRLEEERGQMQQQQQLLEAELDTVRNRAAELAERLAQQHSQLAAERAQWTEELKRMRHVMETLARQHAAPAAVEPPAAAAEEPIAPAQATHETSAAADPVLGSVMAQFEMLQKDVAQRRKRLAGTN